MKKMETTYIFYFTEDMYKELKRYGDCSEAYQDAMQSINSDEHVGRIELRFLNPDLDWNDIKM